VLQDSLRVDCGALSFTGSKTGNQHDQSQNPGKYLYHGIILGFVFVFKMSDT